MASSPARQVLNDQGAGGYFAALPMVAEAMRGSWTPAPLCRSECRSAVEHQLPRRRLRARAPGLRDQRRRWPVRYRVRSTQIDVAAKYLYGATAPDLAIEADAILRPRTTLDAFPGYTFGRLDDTIETSREPLGMVGTTDAVRQCRRRDHPARGAR